MYFLEDVGSLKLLVAFLLFIIDVIMSILPFFLKSQPWFSYLETFAGGIFLSAACFHLIPESMHMLKHAPNKLLAPLTWIFTFTGLFIIEMFAHSHSHDHDHDHGDEYKKTENKEDKEKKKKTKPRTNFALYFILIFHECVEAISLGSSQSAVVIISLFLATIGHKPFETFSLGLSFLKSCSSKIQYSILMLIFSLSAPLTILFMIWFLPSVSDLISGIVASISAGTFLFVAFQELSETFHHSEKLPASKKIKHIISYALGATWIAIISFSTHEHHHHH